MLPVSGQQTVGALLNRLLKAAHCAPKPAVLGLAEGNRLWKCLQMRRL